MNQNLAQTIQLQQIASNPQNSAWVFASAGSGKTKILTDRVLRLLLEEISANKILCLTFTKVAAAEMQNRINSELAQWILCNDTQLQKKLNDLNGTFPTPAQLKKARSLFIKVLDDESKIKVQTIHSFCQSLIKIFPFEAKVKPNFEVLESNQEKLFLKQAQKEVLKKAIHNPELKNLVQKTNSKLHEESFNQLVAELLNKKEQFNTLKEKFCGIENVIAEIFKNFSVKKNQNETEIFDDFLKKINREKNFKLALELENSGLKNNGKIAAAIRFFLEKPLLENFSNYQLAFFTDKNEPRKVSKEIAQNPELTEILNDCQKLISNFCNQINSLKIANNTELLLRFVDQILQNYSKTKKQNAFLDYNDLIVETNRLLINPDFSNWVKLKMDSSFDHILIDESQDTNHSQWNIIKALSEDFFSGLSAANKTRSIFIVGDEKQSIYSFQGANPHISEEIFAYFSQKMGAQLKKIELNNSFRSVQKILQSVDEVFQNSARKNAISKVSLFQEHKAIRQGLGHVEIWQQITDEKEEKKEKNYEWQIDFSNKKPAQEEEILAEIIAQKISKRVAESVQDEKPVKYGDFMILLRNRTNKFNQALTKFLQQYQIPFSSVSKIKFSENLLIQDLLAAAKFALLKADDLNLACLLKSPIFAISEEDLLEICLVKNEQKTTIYNALEVLPKFKQIKESLDELTAKSQELNCFEFFYFLLQQKNHQQHFIAYFGYESLEILDKFLLSTFDFCQNFSPNLQKFLEFIEKLDYEIALSSNENDRVKISTVHSAKGLQARIVMLPDCCYNFGQLLNSKEEISWINFASEFDENKFPIWCAKKEDENLILKKHRQQKLLEAKEEYLRLLYVAMTRAEDELYIAGFGKSSDPECWYEIIKNSVSCAKFVTKEELMSSEITTTKNELPDKLEITKAKNKITKTQFPASQMEIVSTSSIENLISKNSPSQINQSQIKGRLIHKILEAIGKNHREDKNWLQELAKKIIDREEFLTTEDKNKISIQINSFLVSGQFDQLFFGEVKCEIEISGSIENKKIIARIDLLVEQENQILIVDYKSDESLPNQVPQHYLSQLQTYKKLVKNLFPQKKISSAILWTKFLKLQFLHE